MDVDTMKKKAKLDAFFANASKEDIAGLLLEANYDFYKNVADPYENWLECTFAPTAKEQVLTLEIPVMASSYRLVPNRPITYVGRDYPAADHQDLALAA
jgi:hypothetical protein